MVSAALFSGGQCVGGHQLEFGAILNLYPLKNMTDVGLCMAQVKLHTVLMKENIARARLEIT